MFIYLFKTFGHRIKNSRSKWKEYPSVPQNSNNYSVQTLPFDFFKKLIPPPLFRKGREGDKNTKLFAHTSIHILEWNWKAPIVVEAPVRKFCRDYMQYLYLLKMHFPAWYLFLQTLPQKFWAQYLGKHADLIVQKNLFTETL